VLDEEGRGGGREQERRGAGEPDGRAPPARVGDGGDWRRKDESAAALDAAKSPMSAERPRTNQRSATTAPRTVATPALPTPAQRPQRR